MSGKLFLIVGPSGVGKGTLVNRLREKHPDFFFPPSATTRDPRAGEESGKQYVFMSEAEFAEGEQAGKFLETATVHETEKYGTLKDPIMKAIEDGKTVIREVDIQGLVSIRENMDKEKFAAIFISPPNFETLKKRILTRQPIMAPEELKMRIESARVELTQKDLADFNVISEDGQIEKMVLEVEGIIKKN